MTAKSTKGVKVWLQKSDATGTAVTPTDASLEDPSVITVDDTTGIANGDVAVLAAGSTGIPELDGQTWVVGNVTATSFELVGSDASASTATFSSGEDITVYTLSEMVVLCLASLTFNPETPETVSVGTFCDPTASIASQTTQAGTLDFTGYPDVTQADYQELLKWEADGTERIIKIDLPSNGYYVFPATLSQLVLDIPIEGALGYTGNAVLGSKPKHLF